MAENDATYKIEYWRNLEKQNSVQSRTGSDVSIFRKILKFQASGLTSQHLFSARVSTQLGIFYIVANFDSLMARCISACYFASRSNSSFPVCATMANGDIMKISYSYIQYTKSLKIFCCVCKVGHSKVIKIYSRPAFGTFYHHLFCFNHLVST